MKMSILFEVQDKVLIATINGSFSLNESKKLFIETIDKAINTKTYKILVNAININGVVEDMERFYYGEFIANIIAEMNVNKDIKAPKIAYVFNKKIFDERKFGETVAVNRGAVVKIFLNSNDAIEWLNLNN